MRQDRGNIVGMRTLAALAAITASGLAGCAGGHGTYTTQAIERAEERVAGFKAGTEYDLAHQQYLAGDLDKAIRSVEKSIFIKPDVARSHILYARILIEMDRLENATLALNRAIEIEPDNVDAHYFSGILYERFSQFDRAHGSYMRAADLDPTDAQYIIAAAEMLVQTERLEEASALLRAHLTRFEHNAGIRQNLGHIAMMQDDISLAVQMFEEASLLVPGDGAVLEDLAQAQIAAGKYSDAEYSLRRLLGLDDHSKRRDLKHILARTLVELDRPVEARDLLVELTHNDDGASDPSVWIDLANVAMMLEDSGRMRQASSRLIAMAPHQPEGYVLRAMWQQMQGMTVEALETLALGERRCPRSGSIAVLQAVYYKANGERQLARAASERALALMPDDAGAQRLSRLVGVQDVGIADAFDEN